MTVPFTPHNQIVKKNKIKHIFSDNESNERLIKATHVFKIYIIPGISLLEYRSRLDGDLD